MIGGLGRHGRRVWETGSEQSPKRAIESLSNATNVASITLDGFIVPERQASEGLLIKSYAALWIEIAQRLREDWSLARQLTARQWEEMLAGASIRGAEHEAGDP
jgi:restriction system protein